jgi:hypothetical protein
LILLAITVRHLKWFLSTPSIRGRFLATKFTSV